MPTKATVSPSSRKTATQFTSWSYSRYMDYTACPAKAKYKHLDKLPEPGSPAMERGSAIHTLAENYVNGALKRLPPELKLFKDEFTMLKKQPVKVVEENWAWTKDFAAETEWNNWSQAWVRIKLDVAYINTEHNALVVVDHKTGKCRPEKSAEYLGQCELYGLAGLLRYPDIAVVSPRLWYLDEGVIYPDPDVEEIEYFRADEPKLKKIWIKKVTPMLNDKNFKPTPSDHACRFCHYKAANGGPCKY